MKALALCGLKGAATTHPEYVTGAEERTCAGTCGRTIIVAPSTLAIPGVVTMCNECGRGAATASVAAGLVPDLRIPPGALRRDAPEDRRARPVNEQGLHELDNGRPAPDFCGCRFPYQHPNLVRRDRLGRPL